MLVIHTHIVCFTDGVVLLLRREDPTDRGSHPTTKVEIIILAARRRDDILWGKLRAAFRLSRLEKYAIICPPTVGSVSSVSHHRQTRGGEGTKEGAVATT